MQSPECQVLLGQVVGGRGNASNLIQDNISEITDFLETPPFRGSLNVLLQTPVLFNVDSATRFDSRRRRLWCARLDGYPVAIYRWRGCRAHVVEIISPTHLRTVVGYRDGDPCSLEVPVSILEPLSRRQSFVWGLIWLGRRHWCYTKERYQSTTKGIEGLLGLLQR